MAARTSNLSFRGARKREPGIQMQTRCSFLDSGSGTSCRPGMTKKKGAA
jgi:hypothetical protein